MNSFVLIQIPHFGSIVPLGHLTPALASECILGMIVVLMLARYQLISCRLYSYSLGLNHTFPGKYGPVGRTLFINFVAERAPNSHPAGEGAFHRVWTCGKHNISDHGPFIYLGL